MNKMMKTRQELQCEPLHDNSDSVRIKSLQYSHPFSNDDKVQLAFKEAVVRLFSSMIINTKFAE